MNRQQREAAALRRDIEDALACVGQAKDKLASAWRKLDRQVHGRAEEEAA